MKLTVQVQAQAKETRVEKETEGKLRVWVKAPPTDGRANAAVIEALAGYLKIPKSRIVIVRGLSSKLKTIQIF